MPVISRLGVVVPARDESALLPRCLAALSTARCRLHATRPDVDLTVLVVLDSCVDDSAAVVDGYPGVSAIPTAVGNVGAARQAGVRRLASTSAPDWYLSTDADSAVPANWLEHHVEVASAGVDLLLGTVLPDRAEISPERLGHWRALHSDTDGHGHIHGANLGFSRRAWEVTGGFWALAVHEDVDLVERVKSAGLSWVASGRIPVLTSARTVGRTPDGFAGFLRTSELSSEKPGGSAADRVVAPGV